MTRTPRDRPQLSESIAALSDGLGGKRVLVVAAADLAHMGPAFGDPQPLDRQEKEILKGFDREMLNAMCHGDAESFLGLLRQSNDKQKVCGLPPIYAALRLLGPTTGRVLDYAQCPADGMAGSVVSVAGVVWTD